MRSVGGKWFSRILEGHGSTLPGVHGSHHIYGRPGSIVRLSVAIHGNKPLKSGLLKRPLKMAGLGEDDLS